MKRKIYILIALLTILYPFMGAKYGNVVYAAESDHLVDIKVDEGKNLIVVFMDDAFVSQDITDKQLKKIYKRTTKEVHKALPKQYNKYDVRIMVGGIPIEELGQEIKKQPENDIDDNTDTHTNRHYPRRQHNRHGGWWGDIAYDGLPWVTNVSVPHRLSNAMNGKHIALWASHGRYYDNAKGYWKWQRPNLFCTTEDLFTQTIVVPYLIPMLEKAGANVFTPRERDWQTEEVIVDNDKPSSGYSETKGSEKWTVADASGFAIPTSATINDNFNPFEQGSVRQINASRSSNAATAIYKPRFNKAGRYAVYVSYITKENSLDHVLYSVYHKGQRTDFHVNQKMGGGTWVYLGSFDFDEGSNDQNKVVVSSHSNEKGLVTTDAVRFGGGMGNIVRGGTTSSLPRCLEAARYSAQWSGAPYSVYAQFSGKDDYKDDLNSRSRMTNWIAGGSPFAPDTEGKNVPIDLCLAVHSDAGFNRDMRSIYGTLTICTTDFNNGKLASGADRSHSADFAKALFDNTKKDINATFGKWNKREIYDRNYSETRLPAMPSAILETMSHQSFPDMCYGHDPNFKFTLARSIYKTMLRFEAEAHGEKAIVAPLAPQDFFVELDGNGKALLSWSEQEDKVEETAHATSYNVYMASGNQGFDNGHNVRHTSHSVQLKKDVVYRFRVTSVNAGGESFPSEEMSVVWHGKDAKTILVINGFQRLAAPAVRNNTNDKGFDFDEDPGVSYGVTAGWAGKQLVFGTSTAGREDSSGFGYCANDMAGKFVAGNDFNYVTEHVRAIASARKYNVVSCTRAEVEYGGLQLRHYDCVDLILGNERNDGYSLMTYKTFTPQMQNALREYKKSGRGALLVSGSYIGSDMQTEEEQTFLREILGCAYDGKETTTNNRVNGLQQSLSIINSLNPDHYATTSSDILLPDPSIVSSGKDAPFIAMQYGNGTSAAVAWQTSRYRSFAMGFPFECISPAQQAITMRGLLGFLVK